MTEPDSLTEHNAAIDDALERLGDVAWGLWHDETTTEWELHEAARAYSDACDARAEWRAKVRMKPKAGGWPT